MARECGPERDKVEIERAVASLMRLGRRDVKGAVALALHAMVVHARTIPDDDLGHRVRPVHVLCQRRVCLHDRRPRLTLDHDEIARMDDNLPVSRRQEQELNRLRDPELGRHVHERALRHERRVQRAEGSLVSVRVFAQVVLNRLRILTEGLRQARHPHTAGERCRQRRRKEAVDEDQPIASLTDQERLDFFELWDARCGMRQLELRFRDWRDVREAPRFLLEVGEAQLDEASNPALAEILEPGRHLGRPIRRPCLVGANEPFDGACFYCHRHDTITPSRNQS